MTCISITQFAGLAPEIASRNANRTTAQIAHNCLLSDGVLRPMPQWKLYKEIPAPFYSEGNRIYEDTRSDLIFAAAEFRDAVYLTGKPFAKDLLVGVDKNPTTIFGMTTNLRAAEHADAVNGLRALGLPTPNFGTYFTASSVSYQSQNFSLKPVNRIIGVTFCRQTESGFEESTLAVIPGQAPFGIMFEGDIVKVSLTLAISLFTATNITHIRLYRTISGLDTGEQVANELDTDWHLLETIAVRPIIKYNDGGAVTTDPMDLYLAKHFYPPSFNAEHFGLSESGWFYMVACDGRVALSERYLHHAWPTENKFTLQHRVTDVVCHYDTLYVGTTKRPFAIPIGPGEGEQGTQGAPVPFPERLPCLPRTMVVGPSGALYAASAGLVSLTKSGPKVITSGITNPGDTLYKDADGNIATIGKTTLGAYSQGNYFGFCGATNVDLSECDEPAPPPDTCGIPIVGNLPDGSVDTTDNGNLYVSSSTEISVPTYYVIDMNTDSIAVIGADSIVISYIIPNIAETFLYCLNATYEFGTYSLTTNTFTLLNNAHQYGIFVLNSTQTFAYVLAGFGGNAFYKIDTATGAIVDTETMGNQPGSLVITADDSTVYVVTYTSATIYKYDTASGTITNIFDLGTRNGNRSCALNLLETVIYTVGIDNVNSSAWITAYRTDTGAKIDEVQSPEYMSCIRLHPDGSTLAVCDFDNPAGRVRIYDAATLTLQATIVVGGKPNSMYYSPDGRRLYCANYTGNTVSVIDTQIGSPTIYTVIATLATPSFPRLQNN